MPFRSFLAFSALVLFAQRAVAVPASPNDWVDIQTLDVSIKLDMRYATPNNFLKVALYKEPKCFLRRPVAEALMRAQAALRLDGASLKVYDCYRPLSVQKKMWEKLPDERYVADPAQGSRHNRGGAVDLTLVERGGYELEMPSAFDDFSSKAHRDSKQMSKKAKANLKLLEQRMVAAGFVPFATEWWHYDFKGWDLFPVEDLPFDRLK